jgi:hypothetical protein
MAVLDLRVDLDRLRARLRTLPAPREVRWYRLGDGYLALRTDDLDFHRRFASRYGECAVATPPADAVVVVEYSLWCDSSDGALLVSTRGGGRLADLEYALPLYAPAGYRAQSTAAGWRLIHPTDAATATAAIGETDAVLDSSYPWQRFVANLALNHVLGRQQDALFFHGASAGVGPRGVLLLGDKGSGKTTLALALAARGHAFLGDEIAGVETATLRMLPVRRAAAVRDGVAASAVAQVIGARSFPRDTMVDGTTRVRVPVGEVFPRAAASEPALRAVFVLRGFGERPELTPFRPSWEDAATLGPLACSVRGGPVGARALQWMRLFERVPCFSLRAGSPDETVDLLQHHMEGM